ncbi:MAG: hypothetical protein IKB07_08305 [Lachnospiraceae bacterium]|nr:hypothetical protein [Lachnospiraceae bacterium]
MERLVDDIYTFKGKVEDVENDYIIEVQKKLKEYETSEEQGLLLRLPCGVGDTVYYINFYQKKIEEDTVMEFSLETYDWYVRLRQNKWVILDMFKINFYLTREEAESALAEKGGME